MNINSNNFQNLSKVRSVFSSASNSTVVYDQNTGLVNTDFNGDTNGITVSKNGNTIQYNMVPPEFRGWAIVNTDLPLVFYNSATQGKLLPLVYSDVSTNSSEITYDSGTGNIVVNSVGTYLVGGYVNNYSVNPLSEGLYLKFGRVLPTAQILEFNFKTHSVLKMETIIQIDQPGSTYSFYFDNDTTNIIVQHEPLDFIPYRGYEVFLIKLYDNV